MDQFHLYRDIKDRTDGEIYIGVVGPVRCGKSTFIKRFMETLVIPTMTDENKILRTKDELPQSSDGKTIMTTEPKFIPKEAASIQLDEETNVKVRLIDCVGYMVKGAVGHIEDDKERMVKTPWFDYEIPFTKAAEIGTRKVISDHSTIGIVITGDGSFGEFTREDYALPEEQTIKELKALGKPFVVLLNSSRPYSEECKKQASDLSAKYDVTVMCVNCEQLKKEDIHNILQNILMEFPVSELNFYMPKWIEMLENTHPLKSEILNCIKSRITGLHVMRSITPEAFETDCNYITGIKISNKDMSRGVVNLNVAIDDSHYYSVLSELTGARITNEYELIYTIKELSQMKDDFSKVNNAVDAVKQKGYGVVLPSRDEITLEEPEIIRNGTKFGVKIKAAAPSIHFIKSNIYTEISPIVGSEEQAEDLIKFIKENGKENADGIWETNIFGKTIEQIVNEGIRAKIDKLSDETQSKMQDTLQKITNDSKGGVICIII
ncbi:MAG: stage IV sporulation protein A [Lachnospiraceae bacterium]|nr:stage IV sporulation protein A [Lachnospiraceae bacterium]